MAKRMGWWRGRGRHGGSWFRDVCIVQPMVVWPVLGEWLDFGRARVIHLRRKATTLYGMSSGTSNSRTTSDQPSSRYASSAAGILLRSPGLHPVSPGYRGVRESHPQAKKGNQEFSLSISNQPYFFFVSGLRLFEIMKILILWKKLEVDTNSSSEF